MNRHKCRTMRRLISELKQERIAAERKYREACLETGHDRLADKAPSTPAEKESLLATLLTSDELARWKKTEKTGKLSTARSELLHAAHYPPIRVLIELGFIDKFLSTFGATLSAFVSPVTGRIHSRYRVAATPAGRATCSGPNVQQVPRDKRFRRLFVPAPGNVLIAADYAGMELRAAAYISGDPAMTEVFEQGLSLHKLTAARMLNTMPDQVSESEKQGAKAVNFGAVYGIGAAKLAEFGMEELPAHSRRGRSQAVAQRLRPGLPGLRALAEREPRALFRGAPHPDRQRRLPGARPRLPLLPVAPR